MWRFLVCAWLIYYVKAATYGNLGNTLPKPAAFAYPDESLLGDVVLKDCWNFTHGAPEEGVFYSPNYPNDYPNNIECVQYLEARPGLHVTLDFREIFRIEISENCKYDSLEFRDGPFGYSPLIARFCGMEFPRSIIISSTRFLWMRFKSDRNLGDKGFKAVYEFQKQTDHNPLLEEKKVCLETIGGHEPEKLLSSRIFPLADTTLQSYSRTDPVDCTWEIQVRPGNKVRLSNFQVRFPVPGDCSINFIEIYDRTTSSKDRAVHYCSAPLPEYESSSSRVYLRVYGATLSAQPHVTALHTAFRPGLICDKETEFACDQKCISRSLVCNGRPNCPHGQDEENCEVAPVVEETEIPLYMIVLGAVVGVIGTGLLIGLCLTCCHKRKMKKKEKEEQKQQARLKNEQIEMTSNSSNTTLSSKKGMMPPPYYSLPRAHTKSPGHNKDYIHRNSLTNSLQSPSEGEYPDQNSDPGNYKKYIVMDPEEESSPCPSLYNQGPPVLTTIVERHDLPPGHTDIDGSYSWGYGHQGWRQQRGVVEPRSPLSLSENIAKLAQYTIPKGHQQQYADQRVYTPDARYEMYPDQTFHIGKEFKMKYGTQTDNNDMSNEQQKQKLFKMRSQHPDITRDIEIT